VLHELELLREQARLIDDSGGACAAADAAVAAALDAATAVAAELTASRARIADGVAAAVGERIAGLGMADSRFAIDVAPAPLGEHGADRVRLLLAPSDRHEPAPVADVASGGELSRIALALHVATGAVDAPTVLFDEIDAGIGGLTAHAIADTLAELARTTQVLCITHLAQVAAVATSHVRIDKQAGRTTLRALEGDEVVDELCRMLGGTTGDEVVRTHARNLREGRFVRGAVASAPPGEAVADEPLTLDC
jgi:DNA repair protein RecN (Recombination protein N)